MLLKSTKPRKLRIKFLLARKVVWWNLKFQSKVPINKSNRERPKESGEGGGTNARRRPLLGSRKDAVLYKSRRINS